MNYIMYIDCERGELKGKESLLVLGSVIVEENEMKQAIREERTPYYVVVVDFQVISSSTTLIDEFEPFFQVISSSNESISTTLIDEFEPLYERMGCYIEENGQGDDSGIMIFRDQGRSDNQNLRKKCRDLMEGKGAYPHRRFKMSGGLNIQEEANGLNLAKKITMVSLEGLRHILNKEFDHADSQEFKGLLFRRKNDAILGIGITSRRSWRKEIEGVLEDFFGHEWVGKVRPGC